MTPEEIEAMRRDMEAGTPGPWFQGQDGNLRVYRPDGMGKHSGLIASVGKGRTDTRRIARLPRLEAACLALHDEAEALKSENARLRAALASLDRAASEVARRGATTGPQWTKLTVASLQARAALKGETP